MKIVIEFNTDNHLKYKATLEESKLAIGYGNETDMAIADLFNDVIGHPQLLSLLNTDEFSLDKTPIGEFYSMHNKGVVKQTMCRECSGIKTLEIDGEEIHPLPELPLLQSLRCSCSHTKAQVSP